MRGPHSAYAILGLRPGAERAEIEEAYRRLIKLYHPDRAGGDGERAAEITRAYRELRTLPLGELRVSPAVTQPEQRRPFRAGPPLVATIVLLGLVLAASSSATRQVRWWKAASTFALVDRNTSATDVGQLSPFADLDDPIEPAVIARSVDDAMRLHQSGDPQALIDFSRSCEARFRDDPSLTWFDSCAAYDESIVFLEARDPIADSGPFNAAAVTAREMGEGRLLSDDPMAVDGRLHQIRSDVQMMLLPRLANQAAAAAQSGDPDADAAEAGGVPSGA